jgi:hypothetical protein
MNGLVKIGESDDDCLESGGEGLIIDSGLVWHIEWCGFSGRCSNRWGRIIFCNGELIIMFGDKGGLFCAEEFATTGPTTGAIGAFVRNG